MKILEGERLAYYILGNETPFWNQHWKRRLTLEAYRSAMEGQLGYLEEPLTRYLPREGSILEAGCGIGKYVLALKKRGYACEGVESDADTVSTVRGLVPDIPMRLGDVTSLDVPDKSYEAYLSLGVMEHCREGMDVFLKEARRVLSDEGILAVSLPHMNLLRRVKARAGFFNKSPLNHEFYQYAYTKGEAALILERNGFKILEVYNFFPLKGLADEVPACKVLYKNNRIYRFLKKTVEPSRWWRRYFGHMIMFMCKKGGEVCVE